MKIPCDIVMDLLPLYHDSVCNANTIKAIEEHLKECDSCKNVLQKIQNNTVDNFLKKEREEVVRHHTQAVKRKSLVAGISIASVMVIPILVSLIVNLATGHALDWFFIVLTALMTTASVTVIPLIFGKNKGLWTLGSFIISLTLLLLTCAIYSNGDWFFVAIISVLFGLSVLFAPYVINRLPLMGFAAHHKGLLAIVIDTLFLYAVIAVSGLYIQNGTWLGYWRPALLITSVSLLFPWGLFFIIRYVKANSFVRAGLCVIFSGLFASMLDNFIDWILEGVLHFQIKNANLFVWDTFSVINANIYLLTLLVCCVVGGILLVKGLSYKKYSN